MRFEFDLDTEIYPELHASLVSLQSASARAERLRQLAASGLIWEKVRIHGVAAIATPTQGERQARAMANAGTSPPSSSSASADALPVLVERRSSGARRPARVNAPERRRASEFVDLALNAEQLANSPSSAGAANSALPGWHAVEQLPVLMDVVADDRTSADANNAGDHEAMEEVSEAASHVTSIAQKPQTRSRLMRMKERGLFKNG